MIPRYHYDVRFVRVVDGDTVVVDIDQGFNDWKHNQYVRLFGINTAEINSSLAEERLRAIAARDFTLFWFTTPIGSAAKNFWIWSRKYDEREKYGRVLATVMRGDDPVSLNEALYAAGHGVAYMGKEALRYDR